GNLRRRPGWGTPWGIGLRRWLRYTLLRGHCWCGRRTLRDRIAGVLAGGHGSGHVLEPADVRFRGAGAVGAVDQGSIGLDDHVGGNRADAILPAELRVFLQVQLYGYIMLRKRMGHVGVGKYRLLHRPAGAATRRP